LNLKDLTDIILPMAHDGLTPTRKLLLSSLILTTILLGGTIGLSILENLDIIDALYMTIITISTVGFGEVKELSHSGRIFIMIIIVFSLATVALSASALGQFVLEGELRKIMGRKKMQTKIKKLSSHYIIAGFGRVGRQVAEAFMRRKVPFIVIEKDNAALNQLDAEGILYVEGPAIEDDILLTAGVEKAKVLVSTLPEESDNVYLALTARHMNADLHIICRADNPAGEKKLKRAGANYVVSPHILGGMRMATASLRPNVVDFMQMTAMGGSEIGIEEVSVPENSRLTGKSLIDSKIKADYGVTVIGIKKAGQQMKINPPPDAVIGSKDILVLVGTSSQLEKLTTEMS